VPLCVRTSRRCCDVSVRGNVMLLTVAAVLLVSRWRRNQAVPKSWPTRRRGGLPLFVIEILGNGIEVRHLVVLMRYRWRSAAVMAVRVFFFFFLFVSFCILIDGGGCVYDISGNDDGEKFFSAISAEEETVGIRGNRLFCGDTAISQWRLYLFILRQWRNRKRHSTSETIFAIL